MQKVATNGIKYSDVHFDIGGWADAKKFIPADFELCHLKIKGRRDRSGWASGWIWDGINIRENDEILYWKKHKGE